MRRKLLDVLNLQGEWEIRAFDEPESGLVKEGALVSKSGDSWHRIENYILDLLPDVLRNTDRNNAFAEKHNLSKTGNDSSDKDYSSQAVQINFFADDSKVYDKEVSDLPFYKASYQICFRGWLDKRNVSDKFVLDIGGGTGRQVIPLLERNNQIVTADISEEMLLESVAKTEELGRLADLDFVLCDATALPFRSDSFDSACCYGTLHHVPEPGDTVREAGRILKPEGAWFSYDPNDSPIRFLFDWLMNLITLYEEEDSGNDMISGLSLGEWSKEGSIQASINYHTYIPPHICSVLPHGANVLILRASDAVFSNIPGLSKCGGIVMSEGLKAKS